MRRMEDAKGDDEDEEEDGQWRSSLARLCEDGKDERQWQEDEGREEGGGRGRRVWLQRILKTSGSSFKVAQTITLAQAVSGSSS